MNQLVAEEQEKSFSVQTETFKSYHVSEMYLTNL